ncbi:MAG: hypothetical protein ACI936_003687 [Paraglaciecola sp.]|jgi:hypothetical protein
MAVKDEILTLSLVELEKYYFENDTLSAMQEVVCYHATDLIVHRDTAAVISKNIWDTPETSQRIKR